VSEGDFARAVHAIDATVRHMPLRAAQILHYAVAMKFRLVSGFDP
jgi:hypothetical protein